ncbi:TPA: hypothetical protein ACIJ20_005527 [Pseudomonas aeruginosa]|uniref:ParB/Sulfiredoxin domain-containing protein n=1 Tax=Pseudomonas fluorescens TaxID=294 RepID=A0A3S4N2G3_PSEFL|nr:MULTISPECIES: hypothetical protein [Pseudomonas]VEE50072.1 Uncharacterised protein [Pseudomonas fluorescens]EIX9399512.1 hypothetical protein [Pseudomonas aeruginosa]MBN5481459.1 hypothetical protein [Pseudomonas aeruginosa]MCO3466222.1 hypothetical protein [Pseudomonas aeruginosa]MCO3477273.1 hypothetical protein [Pseudomonas aeruginosa]
MVFSSEERKRKLGELISEPSKAQGSQKLYYKNITQSFPVYRIDLDYLIYNRHNGRIEAEMLTWEQEHSITPGHYDEKLHDLIDKFLWTSSSSRNKQTLQDLDEKQQQRPGIVSLDGVIIDGNRRAMLLRRLAAQKGIGKQYFDAIILPDAYDENQKEIVRLETQYQLGEDSKVEYGPLQKYLHARRLHDDLGISTDEIDKLMGQQSGNAAKLLEIMALMDEYLEHIGCHRLYTMLKDSDGTKEGMFVDLYYDLKRLKNGGAKIPWAFDAELDCLALKVIQFDFIRLGEFSDAKKVYREISHQSKGNNFFSHEEIWSAFTQAHERDVDPITAEIPSLEEFITQNPGCEGKIDAARARENVWKDKVQGLMKGNFNKNHHALEIKATELQPTEYLERARALLEKIDIDGAALVAEPSNGQLVMDINRLSYQMKKRFEKTDRGVI